MSDTEIFFMRYRYLCWPFFFFILLNYLTYDILCLSPIALRMANILWTFGHSECMVHNISSNDIPLL